MILGFSNQNLIKLCFDRIKAIKPYEYSRINEQLELLDLLTKGTVHYFLEHHRLIEIRRIMIDNKLTHMYYIRDNNSKEHHIVRTYGSFEQTACACEEYNRLISQDLLNQTVS